MQSNQNQAEYSFDYYKDQNEPIENKKEKQQFNPYVNNQGTILGIYILINQNSNRWRELRHSRRRYSS